MAGATERIIRAAGSPVPTPGDGTLLAPFQFVLSGTEFLRCSLLSAFAGSTVAIRGRMLTPKGEITPFQFTLTCPSDLVTIVHEFQLGPGALLTVSAEPTGSAGSNAWGDNYVTLSVTQGTGAAAIQLGVLMQGYTSFGVPAVWPGTPFRSSLEGPSRSEAFTVAAPAAGAGVVFSGTGGERLSVTSLVFTYTADATVAQRNIALRFKRDTRFTGYFPASVAQAAGTTVTYTFVAGGLSYGTPGGTFQVVAIPSPFWLEPGDLIVLLNIVAGGPADQFSSTVVDTQRWLILPGNGLV